MHRIKESWLLSQQLSWYQQIQGILHIGPLDNTMELNDVMLIVNYFFGILFEKENKSILWGDYCRSIICCNKHMLFKIMLHFWHTIKKTVLDCHFILCSLFIQTDSLKIKQICFPFCSTKKYKIVQLSFYFFFIKPPWLKIFKNLVFLMKGWLS